MRCNFTVGESFGALAKFQHYPKIFVEGPRGTAKSRSILSFLLGLLLQYPGSRLLLCRRFRSELTKTILTTLEDEVFPAFGLRVPGGQHRQGRSEYLLENGSVIWPAGIDDGMGALSMGITYAYAAEVIEMDEETVTDIAGGLRWLNSPEQPTLPQTSLLVLDGNPGAPAHWSNRMAEPVDNQLRFVRTVDDYLRLQAHNYAPAADPVRRWKRIITKHQDNPGYWDHDKWDYTPLGRNYVTQQLEGLHGHKRDRWLNGLWVAAEGSVFPEFTEARNTCDWFSVGDWPIYIAYDSGYDHAAAVIFIAIAPDGQYFIVDEIYGSEIKLAKLAERIKEKVARHRYNVIRWLADPRDCFKKTAHASGRTIADQMNADHGLTFQRWPQAQGPAKVAQVEAVRTQLECELPMQVFKTCSNVVMEFQSWSYKRNADGSVPQGDDAYEDRNNHALDAIMGAIATRPSVEKPAAGVMKRAS